MKEEAVKHFIQAGILKKHPDKEACLILR